MQVQDDRLVEWVREHRQLSAVKFKRPDTDFPEMVVIVPDAWDSILLAPLYDVHIGSQHHDAKLFARHKQWLLETPNVLTWNGGDLIENASKLSVGAGVYEQDFSPQNQAVAAIREVTPIAHKMLFALPGNHEDRTKLMGFDIGQWMAWLLGVPYFADYAFVTLKWRGNKFRLLAHHGSGGAQSAGGQRNAARRALQWARGFDLFWTGHLHNPLVDIVYQAGYDQKTDRMYEQTGIAMISPSYLKYFGSYAAQRQFTPGTRGIAVAELQEDGRIDVLTHARGRRL